MKLYIENTLFILGLLLFTELAYPQAMGGIISNQVQSQISRQVSAGISKNLNENLLIPQLNVRNKAGEVLDFTLSHDEHYFNVLHQDGTVRVWDSRRGVQRPIIRPDDWRFTKVVSSSSSNMVLIGASNGKIYVYDILTAKLVTELNSGAGEAVLAMSVSKSDNKLAVAYADGKIWVWDLITFQKSADFNTNQNDLTDISFTNTDKSLVALGKNGNIQLWDMEKSRKLSSLANQSGKTLGFWESPSAELVFVDDDGNLNSVEQPGNRAHLNTKIPGERSLSAAAIDFYSGLLSLSGNTNKIKLFNFNGLTLVKEITSTAANIKHLQFINQGKYLLGADESGTIHVWDTRSAIELMQLISTNNGWSVVDNTGRFDSSEKGMANVSWLAGDKDIPIDNFSGNYYEPDLLATHLNSDTFINKAPQKIQDGINLPPEVLLTVPAEGSAGEEIQASFEIIDSGGGIGEHRLYQNGKIIDQSLVADSSDSEIDGKLHRKISYKLNLSPGNNKFKVIATNKMGIESLEQQQTVKASGAEEKQPDLYVIAIGINKYDDHSLDLSFSVQDAQSIIAFLGKKTTSKYKNIYTSDILDEAATKEAIISKLNSIAEITKANDALIVYLAGHGIAVKGEWYFLPHEMTFHQEEEYYAKVGVSAKQIKELISKRPAEKILMMFDSCYSGSGIKVFEDLNKTQRHFGRSLSKTDGIVVLAATRKDQEALELAELGHGLFTYIVGKGMSGAADLNPRDQNISAHEVVSYVADTIPTFTRKFSNAAQEPTSFTIGDDFMLLGL